MKNYFYKINSRYIESFSKNVLLRFRNNEIRTDNNLLKSIFKELNFLFKFLGGKISDKSDIPKPTDYPDSNKFNKLIRDIGDDIQKLYTSQKLIEDDVNNLLNFNSTQRLKIYENFTSIQQLVYSTYIKNKKDVFGEIVIPVGNPFSSADNKDESSNNIYIDETRGVLTLAHDTKVSKPIDTNNVQIFFAGNIPSKDVYPNTTNLGIGSHWRLTSSPGTHFIDTTNKSEVSKYLELMIDDPNSNTGIGWVEYEAVKTELNSSRKTYYKQTHRISDNDDGTITFNNLTTISPTSNIEYNLKNFIGKSTQIDPELIYLDINNSLQGNYVNQSMVNGISINNNRQYKLVVPFKINSNSINEFIIDFEPDYNGYYPKIVWDKSLLYSNQNGSDIAYKLLSPSDPNKIPENGVYNCIVAGGFVKPSRLEIVIEYGSDDLHWYQIGFFMSHYMYKTTQPYELDNGEGDKISLILEKSYDIYVDSEANKENEKTRALNVLHARGK